MGRLLLTDYSLILLLEQCSQDCFFITSSLENFQLSLSGDRGKIFGRAELYGLKLVKNGAFK